MGVNFIDSLEGGSPIIYKKWMKKWYRGASL